MRWLAVAAICQRVAAGVAETNAVIPYETVDRLCQIAAETDQTKLVVRVCIAANHQTGSATNLAATIQSRRGHFRLELGEGGRILHFPHTKELSRENPLISVNRPKGTLGLTISAELPIPENLSFRYALLSDGVAEANRMIQSQAGWMSLLAPKAHGVGVFFRQADAGTAKVEILSANGRIEFTADEHGVVKIKLEPALVRENPEVRLSEKPLRVVPFME